MTSQLSGTLSDTDIADLSADQQNAILEALFLAVGIDRQVDAEERSEFRQLVESIPWTIDATVRQNTLVGARDRVVSTKSQDEFLAWIRSIADLLPDVILREKVVRMMASLAFVNGLDRNEQGLLNAFLLAFETPPDVIEKLRVEFGRQA